MAARRPRNRDRRSRREEPTGWSTSRIVLTAVGCTVLATSVIAAGVVHFFGGGLIKPPHEEARDTSHCETVRSFAEREACITGNPLRPAAFASSGATCDDLKPTEVVHVLFDLDKPPRRNSSTRYTQKETARDLARGILTYHVRQGTRVVFWQLTDDENTVKRIWQGCDPGLTDASGRLGYKAIARKRKEGYLALAHQGIEDGLLELKRSNTPLAAGIATITSSFSFFGDDPTVSKKLFIISDMLPSVGKCDAFGPQSWDTTACKNYLADNRPRLVNASVDVHVIERNHRNAVQGKKMYAFWRPYFANGGAHDVHFSEIQ